MRDRWKLAKQTGLVMVPLEVGVTVVMAVFFVSVSVDSKDTDGGVSLTRIEIVVVELPPVLVAVIV